MSCGGVKSWRQSQFPHSRYSNWWPSPNIISRAVWDLFPDVLPQILQGFIREMLFGVVACLTCNRLTLPLLSI